MNETKRKRNEGKESKMLKICKREILKIRIYVGRR
jgi:hypothetical protein